MDICVRCAVARIALTLMRHSALVGYDFEIYIYANMLQKFVSAG